MRVARWAVLLLALPGLVGCGNDWNTATVSGNVSVDGKPVEDGAINFVPVDGEGWTAGGIIKHGRYSVRVPMMSLKVAITASKVVGKKPIYDAPNSPEMPITVQTVPARFNEQTELRLEVQGNLVKDFDLSSQ
jgi:hypothetical protein